MKGIRRGGLAVILGLGVLAALAPATSVAASSKYQPRGWHGSVEYGPGGCVRHVNCPKVTNTRHMRGGVAGAGFLRTKLHGLTGVAAQSRGIWQSGTFRYRGVKGKRPDQLRLTVTRRSRVAALLNGAGNSVNYTVEIVRRKNGGAVAAIDHRKLNETRNWTRVVVRLLPGALQIGQRYSLRLTTEFKTGQTVFPSATADYSRIAVRAWRKGQGGHPPAARNNRLRIRVPCARKYRPGRCKIRTIPVLHRGGRAIARAGHARVRAGHRKLVTMRVRRPYRHWVAAHSQVLVRERVRTHGHVHRFYRHYRIVRQ
jgi:hypothetical protein